MKRIYLVYILLFACSFAHPQQAPPTNGLLGFFKLDGNAKEAEGRISPGKQQGVKPAADRLGNHGKAVGLSYDLKTNKRSFISIPIDINRKNSPLLTITFWIQMNNSNLASGILYQSENEWSRTNYYRGVYVERNEGYLTWTACCGSDGALHGPLVLAKAWAFIALVYDRDDQAMRMVVNDQVYSSAANMRDGIDRLRIGPFDGQIDELRVYSRVLTLAELESLYGKAITKDTSDYPIAKRSD